MSRRPTIADLARAARVSVATVDRVLNGRHKVRDATAAAVLEAAEALGYHAAPLIRQRLAAEPAARALGFLLLRRADPFYQALAEDLAAAARAAQARPVIEFMEDAAPLAIARAIGSLGARVEALAVVAQDHPHVTEAVASLRAPVFTLLSDLTAESRAGYIGIDNRKSGRTAAWAIARLARHPGPVAVLVGSHRYLGQELREIAFRSYLREHAPHLPVLETLVNLEDPDIAHRAARDVLARHADLAGFYVAGGGMGGVVRAMREADAGGRVALVCHELLAETRAGLIDGTVTLVINTPRALVAARAVEAMGRALDGGDGGAGAAMLPFELFVAENI